MPTPFTLTPEEAAHVRHYVWDATHAAQPGHIAGPATRWLWEHGIFPTTMQPFQLAAQRSVPDWYTWFSEVPPVSFEPAWSSREEFESRAREALEAFPEMKRLGSALPGYRPEHDLERLPVGA